MPVIFLAFIFMLAFFLARGSRSRFFVSLPRSGLIFFLTVFTRIDSREAFALLSLALSIYLFVCFLFAFAFVLLVVAFCSYWFLALR